MINCAGCPTLAAPGKILNRVRAVGEYRIDALHFSYCMTALCPFLSKYEKVIHEEYPNLTIVHGTHKPLDKAEFHGMVRELLCPSASRPKTMSDRIKESMKSRTLTQGSDERISSLQEQAAKPEK